MNEYDSEKMADLLDSTHGYSAAESAEEADIILLNTCSIREKAQEKVFHQLGRWKNLKQDKPELIIGVGGCVASQEGDTIRQRAPFVDLVFGPQTLHRLPEMINQLQGGAKSVIDVSFPEIEKFDRLPEPRAEGPTAFVSIMEGCSKYCTFCVVPYTRGEEVSRPVDDVLLEIAQLAGQGVREVNLLGQNVNAYRGENYDGTVCRFSELLELVAAIDGIDRIRYTTSHPVEFTDDIIDAYASIPELVDHLHLPVQSGSDRILNLMKRGHTALEYKSKMRKLKKVRPNISLSSDFIIGFPGETDTDFEASPNSATPRDSRSRCTEPLRADLLPAPLALFGDGVGEALHRFGIVLHELIDDRAAGLFLIHQAHCLADEIGSDFLRAVMAALGELVHLDHGRTGKNSLQRHI